MYNGAPSKVRHTRPSLLPAEIGYFKRRKIDFTTSYNFPLTEAHTH